MKKLFSICFLLLSLNAFTQAKDTVLVKVPQILDISDTSRYATGVKAGKLRNKTRWQIDGFCVYEISKDTLNPDIKTFYYLDEKGLPLNKKYKVWLSSER